MKMLTKTLLLCTAIFALGFTQPLAAQSAKEETELIQSIWGMEKKEIFKEYMELNEVEAQAFWPVYEEYAEKRKAIGSERINIIMDYANNYSSMTDDKAKEITNNIFSNNMKLEKLQKKYYAKLSKVITPLKATEFMQLEKYLDTAVKAEIQENIPFLKELDKMKSSS